MILFIRGLLLLFVCCLSVARAADTGWLTSPDASQAQIRLRAEPVTSDNIHLLLDVQLDDGWKTYWRSPGEGGIAPSIRWEGDLKVQWFWPRPQRFDVSGLTAQGYTHRVTFPMLLSHTTSKVLRGVMTLSLCNRLCVLAEYPFELHLDDVMPPGFSDDIAQALRTIPHTSGPITVTKVNFSRGLIMLNAENPSGWQAPALFLDTLEGASFAKPALHHQGSKLTATFAVTDEWGAAAKNLSGKTLSLVLADVDNTQQFSVPIERSDVAPLTLWAVLLSALLGGFILNLMPCVLPVLGMKLSSVLQVDKRDQRWIRWRFLATSAGVITSFALLALLMTTLRLAGAEIGWGVQFQSPWFLGFMVLITLFFGLNLAGIFSVRLPASLTTRLATAGGTGAAGSFCEGMFATLLATPCSAPFLGTAVTFALTAPLVQLWGVFLMLGLGMSLPWLLIAAVPRLTRLLPKPGHWMHRLRLVLALMMIISSLWLLSLFSAFFDTRYVVLAGGMIVAWVLYLAAGKSSRWKENGRTLAFTLLFGASFYAFLAPSPQGRASSPIPWQPLTEQALNQALHDGKRVFVDVTADWCINCKVNELRVLHRPDVVAALKQDDVVALQGDWTKPSEDIRQFFRRYGAGGVPFNAIYGPSNPEGVVLSPLLDKQHLLKTLESAKGTAQ